MDRQKEKLEKEQVVQDVAESFRLIVNKLKDSRNNLLIRNLLNDMTSVVEKYKETRVECETESRHIETSQDQQLSTKCSSSTLPIFLRITEFIQSQQLESRLLSLTLNSVKEMTTDAESDAGFAVEQALAIDLILDEIFGHLSASDLKTCRAVSYQWNLNATKIIRKKQLFQILLHVVSGTSHLVERIQQNSSDESTFDLRELSELITNPKIEDKRKSSATQTHLPWLFPATYFGLWFSNVSYTAILPFTESCGHIIKTLKLMIDDQLEDNPQDVDGKIRRLLEVEAMLTHRLPNLETMILLDFPQQWWYESDDLVQLFPDQRSLSPAGIRSETYLTKLKTLELRTYLPTRFLINIVESAPSLSSIIINRVCDPKLLQQLAERNKIHLVTDIRLEIFPFDLPVCENVLEMHGNKMRLQKLAICLEDSANTDYNYWNRGYQVIAKFLRCCCRSLVELLTDRFGCWPGFEIPVLPRLKIVRVASISAKRNDAYNHYLSNLFPRRVKLSEIFPSLETFHVSIHADGDWDEKIGAPSNDQLESLKRMFIVGMPADFVVKFCNMFPCVKTACVVTCGNFRVAARAIWSLNKLEDLTIGLKLIHEGSNMHPALDAGFTGFSDETCLQLYASSRDVDISTVTALREHVSILDLRNLRRFDMYFLGFNTEYGRKTYPLISHVTGIFAFKMCPQLRVRFSYDAHYTTFKLKWLKMAISPILPYVDEFGTFEFRYDKSLA